MLIEALLATMARGRSARVQCPSRARAPAAAKPLGGMRVATGSWRVLCFQPAGEDVGPENGCAGQQENTRAPGEGRMRHPRRAEYDKGKRNGKADPKVSSKDPKR